MFLPLLLVACGQADSPAPTEAGDSAAGGAPSPEGAGEGGTLRIAIQSEGKILDPHRATDAASMRLIENLYSTLFRYADEYGEVEPNLVESYFISEDGLIYTFTLRPDLSFHSGEALTADDVKYSIERIRENEARAAQFETIEEIRIEDDRTFSFVLDRPLAPLLTYLAYPMNAIVDRSVVEANEGSLDFVDAGSGPFRLVEWRQDDRFVADRFEEYFEADLPYLARIVFEPVPDETRRMTALRTGEVDLVLDVPEKDIPRLESAEGITVESVPGTFWEYLGLNTRRPPLDDPRVRQAIAWTIDRDMLNQLVKMGRATPLTGGHIPPNHWAHADFELYPQRDLDRARALLAEAGVTDSRPLVLKVGSSFPYQVRAAQIVKQQLSELGFDIEIQAQESGVFFDALGQGDFDMTVAGWLGFVDPDEWTYNLFHTGAKWNQQGYSNEEVDRLLVEARTATDRDRRVELYREIQRIVAKEAPMVFLYINPQTSAYRDAVSGYEVHPTGATTSLRKTTIAE